MLEAGSCALCARDAGGCATRVLLCILEAVEFSKFAGDVGGAGCAGGGVSSVCWRLWNAGGGGGGVMCASLYAGGRRVWDLFVGGVGGDTLCVEAWRSGGALHACRCGGKEVWRSRARE